MEYPWKSNSVIQTASLNIIRIKSEGGYKIAKFSFDHAYSKCTIPKSNSLKSSKISSNYFLKELNLTLMSVIVLHSRSILVLYVLINCLNFSRILIYFETVFSMIFITKICSFLFWNYKMTLKHIYLLSNMSANFWIVPHVYANVMLFKWYNIWAV